MNHFGETQKFGLTSLSDRVKLMASVHQDLINYIQLAQQLMGTFNSYRKRTFSF